MIDFEKYAELGENYNYVKEQFRILRELLQGFKSREGKSVQVFLQGSYKNKTNIGRESDIDIVVYYKQVFYSNIRFPEDEIILNIDSNITSSDIERFNNTFLSANYTAQEFKLEVMNYLKLNSNYIVTEGNKTIKCQILKKEFVFDVVCAFQYRQYDYFIDSNTEFIEGNTIFNQYGNKIINFPKQSFNNSVYKNKNLCDGNYKETVRIIKNIMKNDINEQYWIPSFALESIIYNVDSKYFLKDSKEERCKDVIVDAFNLICSSWDNLLESNELLFIRNISGLSQEKAKSLVAKIIELILINLNDKLEKSTTYSRLSN